MRSIFLVFAKEFLENLRDRRTIMAALVFGPVLGPIMLAALLQISTSRGGDSLDFGGRGFTVCTSVDGFTRVARYHD